MLRSSSMKVIKIISKDIFFYQLFGVERWGVGCLGGIVFFYLRMVARIQEYSVHAMV